MCSSEQEMRDVEAQREEWGVWGGRVGRKGVNQGRHLCFQTSLPFTSCRYAHDGHLTRKEGAGLHSHLPKTTWELSMYQPHVPMPPGLALALQLVFPQCLQNLGGLISPPSPILSLIFFILSFPVPREAGSSLYPRRWPAAWVAGPQAGAVLMSEVSE